MKGQREAYIGIGRAGKAGKRKAWMRRMGSVCLALLVLLTCAGCASFVSAEEMDALRNELVSVIELLQGENDAAQGEIDALRQSHEAAQKEIASLKESYAVATQSIDALSALYETAREELDSLKSHIEAAQKEMDTLKADNETAQTELLRLTDSYRAAQEELDLLKSSYDAARREIERLKEQIQKLQEGLSPDEPVRKIRIYIDQGHNPTGQHNVGASGNGLYEQDLTFTIGCLLAQLLQQDGRFEVCLSRPTASTVLGSDNASSLEARVRGAREFGADYFISLHTNSFSSASANGIEVFVAEQNGTSYALGNRLLQELVRSTDLRERGVKLDPELYVLKNATMPAVLIEMGFISNSGDAALLSQHPERFAYGIYHGILAHLGLSSNTDVH